MLKDMSLSKDEAKEYATPSVGDAPKYPWGLQINLCDDDLKKLGISNMPAGTKVTIVAEANVTSEGTNQNQSGETENNMTLQITSMDITGVNGTSAADKAKTLYSAGVSGE
jgi:hypothetical protein